MRSRLTICCVLLVLLAGLVPVSADPLLDRIKSEGVLRCAATERPGYATIEGGEPAGRAATLCRAVAQAVLGGQGRFALRLLDLDGDFDRVRNGQVELSFLEQRVVDEQRLGSSLTPLAEAYRDSFAVMVPRDSAAEDLGGLRGATVCFMIGDPVWPLLQATLARQGVGFRPFGFSEEVEMKDAYNVGRCGAVAGLVSELGELAADPGVNHRHSRLIQDALGPDPVFAMVPTGDPDLAAVVRHAMATAPAR